MKSTWLLILMVMLTVQTLGLSHAAPVYSESNPSLAQGLNGDMPCHSIGESTSTAEMTDCCAEQDCSCCWGCSGLLSTILGLAPAVIATDPHTISATRDALTGKSSSPFRPPIFA